MTTKKQKRLEGARRQAENRAAYEAECKERLDKVREHRAEQQRLLMAERARIVAAGKINGLATANKLVDFVIAQEEATT